MIREGGVTGHRRQRSRVRPGAISGKPQWGRVRIVAGRWKGRAGSYDDDEGRYCIVYPDGVDGYVLVRPSSIVQAPRSGDSRARPCAGAKRARAHTGA